MYGYLSVHGGKLFCADGCDVIVYDGAVRRIRHSVQICHVAYNIVVDASKILFEVRDTMVPIVRLPKAVSAIAKRGRIAYVADRFGDVHRIDIEQRQHVLLLGNMCYNTSLCVSDSRIVTADKYGRLRVSQHCGRIEKYAFNDNVLVVSIVWGRRLAVALRQEVRMLDEKLQAVETVPFPGESIRKLVEIDEDRFLVLGERTFVMHGCKVICVHRKADDAAWFNGKIALIADGVLLLGGEKLCSLQTVCDDFLRHVERMPLRTETFSESPHPVSRQSSE
eukprot:jgi/Antlo1/1902/2385